MGKLPSRCVECDAGTGAAEFPPVERISAAVCLGHHLFKITIDGRERGCVRTKALELWMMPVSLGVTPEHGTREQALAPERHQSAGVEIPGMQRPEAHRHS
jgi:hypothetical protein